MQSFRSPMITEATARQPALSHVENATALVPWLTSHPHRVIRHQHAAGDRIFSEDDETKHLYVLAKGWVLQYKSLFDGRRQVLDFALPGEMLGFVGEHRAQHAAEMLTDGEVILLPREMLDTLAATNPVLMLTVLRQLEGVSRRAHEHVVSIGCRAALSRVCRLLIELTERLTPCGCGGRDIDVAAPIKQLHIADALGLRVETVCRALKRLARANLATFQRGRLQVPDLDALRRIAEIPDADLPPHAFIRRSVTPVVPFAA